MWSRPSSKRYQAFHDPCIKCECFEIEKTFIKFEKPDDLEAILKEKYYTTNPKIIKSKENGNDDSLIQENFD